MTSFLVGDRVEYTGSGDWNGLQGTVRDVANEGRMVVVKGEPDGIVRAMWNRNLTRIPRPILDGPLAIESNEVHGPNRTPEPMPTIARDGSLRAYLQANVALDPRQIEAVATVVDEWLSSLVE